jgi:hypothetical protein
VTRKVSPSRANTGSIVEGSPGVPKTNGVSSFATASAAGSPSVRSGQEKSKSSALGAPSAPPSSDPQAASMVKPRTAAAAAPVARRVAEGGEVRAVYCK